MKSISLLFLSFTIFIVGHSQIIKSDEIAKGLKEALQVGTTKGIELLSKPDGFFGNAAIKILMPPEAAKIEKTLRSIGFKVVEEDYTAKLSPELVEKYCLAKGEIIPVCFK